MKLLSLCASMGLSLSLWGRIELTFQFSFPRASPMPMLAKSSVVLMILCVASVEKMSFTLSWTAEGFGGGAIEKMSCLCRVASRVHARFLRVEVPNA